MLPVWHHPHSGDLRLVEKPTPTVLGPHGFENIKATIKISSTENGIIFGNIGKLNGLPSYSCGIFCCRLVNGELCMQNHHETIL